MQCKCGASTYRGHLEKAEGGFPGHVYSGSYWAPRDDKDNQPDGGHEAYVKSMKN